MKCPKCQLEIPDDFNFCNGCGHNLSKSKENSLSQLSTEGERKYATVLTTPILHGGPPCPSGPPLGGPFITLSLFKAEPFQFLPAEPVDNL